MLELELELKDGRGMYQERFCSIWKKADKLLIIKSSQADDNDVR